MDNIEVAELLITRGADVNAKDESGQIPLHNANVNMAEFLINKGADVNIKDDFYWIPLHSAINYEKNELIRLLISKDSNVNAKDYNNETPLHLAVKKGGLRFQHHQQNMHHASEKYTGRVSSGPACKLTMSAFVC